MITPEKARQLVENKREADRINAQVLREAEKQRQLRREAEWEANIGEWVDSVLKQVETAATAGKTAARCECGVDEHGLFIHRTVAQQIRDLGWQDVTTSVEGFKAEYDKDCGWMGSDYTQYYVLVSW